jgi:hypothetical protein
MFSRGVHNNTHCLNFAQIIIEASMKPFCHKEEADTATKRTHPKTKRIKKKE